MKWLTKGVVCTLLWTSVATAQPSRDPELAKPEVAKGAAHFERGEFHEAYLQFKRAAATYPSPHVRAKIVLAGVSSSVPSERVDAARIARALLREGQMRADDVEKVQEALGRVRSSLGLIEFAGTTDRQVRVADEHVDPDALRDGWDVLPGTYMVRIGTREQRVRLAEGDRVVVGLAEPKTSEPPPAPSSSPSSSPSAGVSMRPPTRSTTRWSTGKKVTEGALIAVGVGALATSAVFFGVAQGQKDDTQDTARAPADRADSRDGYDTSRTLSTVFFYTGVGVAACAALLPFVWKNEVITESGARIKVAPTGITGAF